MSFQFLPTERPIITTRQHWVLVAPAIVGAVIVMIAGLIAIALVPSKVLGYNVGSFRGLAALILVGVMALTIMNKYLLWKQKEYILTDHRIVMSGGIIARSTESIALNRVQDTFIRQSGLEQLFSSGDIEIESAGKEGREILRWIPKAQTFYNALMQACESLQMAQVSPGLQQQRYPGQAGNVPPTGSNGGA